MRKVIGTDEVIGGIVTALDWSEEISISKDGRSFTLELERDWGYCYCYPEPCSCSPSFYWRAYEEVPDEPKKSRKKKGA